MVICTLLEIYLLSPNWWFCPLALQSDYLGKKILLGLEISNIRFITSIS
jgi:hypothetical protein